MAGLLYMVVKLVQPHNSGGCDFHHGIFRWYSKAEFRTPAQPYTAVLPLGAGPVLGKVDVRLGLLYSVINILALLAF